MFFLPSWHLEAVSSYAKDIDNLILLIFVLVGFWFLVAEAVFFYFILKFRAKDGVKAQYIDGTNKAHKKWITWPHNLILFCDLFIVAGAVYVWYNVKQVMPEPDETVRIVAQQWQWSFQHAGLDGKLDTADDVKVSDELHVKEGLTYHFELVSRDVLHNFSVPVFRLKQDMIPGRVIKGWFKAEKSGTWEIQCAEMCGIGHGIMGGRIVVESKDDHLKWLATAGPKS